ncbi:Alpha/Beta hydrolase fold [Phytophthora cactorum]|nr:Alpha/Beta hydrolase fold [Phytophthora cactorum]
MVGRRLKCKSPNCQDVARPRKCPDIWKFFACSPSTRWVILSNDKAHLRGSELCSQQPRAKYNRWQQGSKNSVLQVRQLVAEKAYTSGIDPETAFVFGIRDDDDELPLPEMERTTSL